MKSNPGMVLCGGAYKPLERLHSFQGLGREGLDWWRPQADGLPVVSETGYRDIELFLETRRHHPSAPATCRTLSVRAKSGPA